MTPYWRVFILLFPREGGLAAVKHVAPAKCGRNYQIYITLTRSRFKCCSQLETNSCFQFASTQCCVLCTPSTLDRRACPQPLGTSHRTSQQTNTQRSPYHLQCGKLAKAHQGYRCSRLSSFAPRLFGSPPAYQSARPNEPTRSRSALISPPSQHRTPLAVLKQSRCAPNDSGSVAALAANFAASWKHLKLTKGKMFEPKKGRCQKANRVRNHGHYSGCG